MQDGAAPASAKVSAAKTILEQALRGVELEDLEARIAATRAGLPAWSRTWRRRIVRSRPTSRPQHARPASR